MRRMLILVVLLGVVSCTAPPPPGDPFAPVVSALNSVFLWLPPAPPPMLSPPPGPGRLTLSNFVYDRARVQALVTAYPDCGAHEGVVIADFVLPLNGTRVIEAAPGADVCWRREFPPDATPGGWTEWNRDYTGTGRSIDTKL